MEVILVLILGTIAITVYIAVTIVAQFVRACGRGVGRLVGFFNAFVNGGPGYQRLTQRPPPRARRVSADPPRAHCPRVGCAHVNRRGARFCTRCGRPLHANG